MSVLENLAAMRLFSQQCRVGNRSLQASSGASIDVVNPWDGSVIGQVPALEAREIEHCIAEAEHGFWQWRGLAPIERSRMLRRWFELMLSNKKELAYIMTAEQGKPLPESEAEIDYAASFVEWFSQEALRGHGEVIPANKIHQQLLAYPEPVGVCVALTPWNFPAAMITRKAAAALAAGCSMIVKPSSETPFSAIALALLAEEAGIPAGVLNVVTAKSDVAAGVFTASPLVKKVSFTGSTRVGRILMEQCSAQLKKLSLELGGNAPFVVFADADIEAAVNGTVAAKLRNAGQTCISPNRFFVEQSVVDRYVAALTQKLDSIVVGNGFEDGVDLGPLINQQAIEKVQAHFDDAITKGAHCVYGERPGHLAGNCVAPVILSGINPTMTLWHEETFGPLIAIGTFSSEEQALALANDTPYGLASYFYTQSASRVKRFSRQLKAGMVGVNEGAISNAMAPFGGVDQSGYGREGGRQGLAEYQTLKYVCQG